jgi:anthranilate phosphoribosyltransferase
VIVAEFDPLELGIARASLGDLRGGDAAHNSGVVRAVLGGQPGPVRDIVVLNAAAAIAASEGLKPVVDRYDALALAKVLGDGVARASEAVDSGAAGRLLARWAEASHRLAIPGQR